MNECAEDSISNLNLFRAGVNCWQFDQAQHVAPLIDCANYYRALYYAILKARHNIFILGWEVDSTLSLLRGEEAARSAVSPVLIDLLSWKAKSDPNLQIYILRWDASLSFLNDRELLSGLVWTARTPSNIHVCLDSTVPMGGSHHQKIILIDDELVFTGGMDIARQRWDEQDHRVQNDLRFDLNGPYGPYHDVQVMMDGPVVQAFSELVRNRWAHAALYPAVEPQSVRKKNQLAEAWPVALFPPEIKNITVAISRSWPEFDGQSAIKEVFKMYLDLIQAAEKFIYIENQFLTVKAIAHALNKKLIECPSLRVLIVSSYQPKGLFEREGMWAGRIEFKEIVSEGISEKRFRLVYPSILDDVGSRHQKRIHSKILVIDNQYVTIGSSNINNRSMNLDSECDVTLEAQTQTHREWIEGFRNSLLAEHTGLNVKQVVDWFYRGADLNEILEMKSTGYHLKNVQDEQFTNQSLKTWAQKISDPEELGVIRTIQNPPRRVLASGFLLGFVFISALIILVINAHWLSWSSVADFLEYARSSSLSLPLVCVAYVVGGLLFFPVTALSLLTAGVFGIVQGSFYGLIGGLLSASVMFWIGHWIGHQGLRGLFGSRVRMIDQYFKEAGIIGVAILRFVPLAPYSLINLAAGVSSIRFRHFFWGTLIGFLPGFLAKGFVADSLVKNFTEPTEQSKSHLILALLLWAMVTVISFGVAKRWKTKRQSR